MTSGHCIPILSAHFSENKKPGGGGGLGSRSKMDPRYFFEKQSFVFYPKLIFLCLSIHSKKLLSQTR